jgi:hypothetical protein
LTYNHTGWDIQVFQNGFTGIKGFGAPGGFGQSIEAVLNLGG